MKHIAVLIYISKSPPTVISYNSSYYPGDPDRDNIPPTIKRSGSLRTYRLTDKSRILPSDKAMTGLRHRQG
ncbi:hypothetical protein V9785_32335, partial [Klebsiella pneumoniae]